MSARCGRAFAMFASSFRTWRQAGSRSAARAALALLCTRRSRNGRGLSLRGQLDNRVRRRRFRTLRLATATRTAERPARSFEKRLGMLELLRALDREDSESYNAVDRTFRYGNEQTLRSKYEVSLSDGVVGQERMMTISVVPGAAPLSVSKTMLEDWFGARLPTPSSHAHRLAGA